MPQLYLKYSERRTGGERLSDEPWSSHEPETVEVSFKSLSKKPDGFFGGYDINVDEDVYNSTGLVYLVIYRYQTGNTFGTSYGNWGVWLATTSEGEATRAHDDILSGKLSKKGHYLPWEGYFERLEDVEIHSFVVDEETSSVPIFRH